MATISLTIRKVEHSPKEGIVYLRFTSKRKSNYLSLKVRVKREDFSRQFPYIKKNAPHSARLNSFLRNELNKAQDILFDYQIKRETLTFQAFKSQFYPKKDMLFKEYALSYFSKRVDSRNEEKTITKSTYRTYKHGIKCFTQFANDPYIGEKGLSYKKSEGQKYRKFEFCELNKNTI